MYGKRKRCEVLVVGAGPVGQLAALVLRDRGIDVRLVDEAERATGRSYAAAIHPRSLELLAEVGLADTVIAQSRRVDAVAFYEGGEERARVNLGELETQYPFVAVTPQSALEALLHEELHKRGVPILWHHRAAGFELMTDRVEVEVDVLAHASSSSSYARGPLTVEKTLPFDARYVVAADGRSSLLRRGCGIDYQLVGTAEQYDVFEFESAEQPGSEVSVVLDERTANIMWTLPGSRQRWTFQVTEPGSESREHIKSRLGMQVPGESSPKHTAAFLHQLIRERAPWFDAPIGDIAWAGEAHFEHRLVDAFGRGPVWLAGDAAHQTSPIGVQSMNVGLAEAVELSSRLEEILHKGASAELLQDYSRERLGAWQRLLGVERRGQVRDGTNDWVRGRVERIVECLPASGAHLDQLLAQLGWVA